MRIEQIKEHSYEGFKARLKINDKSLLKTTKLYNQTTSLDTMFKENRVVKMLDSLSVFIKNRILCKFFDNPQNGLAQQCVNLQRKAILYSRKFADRLFLMNNLKEINILNNIFTQVKADSPAYIEEIAKLGKTIKKKFIDINTEDKVLEGLVKSNQSAIFVMNHPNYHKDKFIYIILNSLLNQMYVAQGKQKSCPRPKILVSKNMLKIVHEKVSSIYKALGMVPVDASLKNKNSEFNVQAMKGLLKSFTKNKSNVFIFPEGNNSAYIDRTLEERMQPGVAEFIKKSLNYKPDVNVIPVSIHYGNDKNSFGKVYVGEPILFSKNKSGIIYRTKNDGDNVVNIDNNSTKTIMKLLCKKLELGIEQAKLL